MDILQATQERNKKYFKESASSLLFHEFTDNCISTGSENLDNLLGTPTVYGISKGVITEICGFSGNGKSQLWLGIIFFL